MKGFLSQLGVSYEESDVSRDRAAAQEMVNRTGQMGVPVTDVDGELVIGFDRARLQQLLSRRPTRPRFGLKVADAGGQGALVGAVAPASPAARAGLQAGDIVTEINRGKISGAADLEKAVTSLRPGSHATVVFLRQGTRRAAEAVI